MWGETVLRVFCKNSSSPQQLDSRQSSIGLSNLLDPDSCSNHALVIFVHSIVISVILLVFLHRICSRRILVLSRPQFSLSPVFSSAILDGFLGLAYLSMSSRIIYQEKPVLPLHEWLVMLLQGLTWLLLSLTLCRYNLRVHYITPLKFSAVLTFCLEGFICLSWIQDPVFLKTGGISCKNALDAVSFFASVFLLFVTFSGRYDGKYDCQEEINGGDFYTALANEERYHGNRTTPFAKAGFFNKMSFWWLNLFMKTGKQKVLEDADVPELRYEDRADTCYSKYIEALSNQQNRNENQKGDLLSAILVCHQRDILVSGLFALIKVLTVSAGPLFLKAFIDVAEGKQRFKHEGYVLTIGLFTSKLLESLSERQWYFKTRLIGLQVRSTLSAATYQKQLKLSNAAKLSHSPAQIMNYFTVDAYRIGEFPYWFHQIWTTSLQICLASAIVYYSMGMATVVALTALIISVLASSPVVRRQLKFQITFANAQDRRLTAISEALANMKILKLYAWETHFKNLIENLRKQELESVFGILLLRGCNIVLFWCAPIGVTMITFWACYILGVPLYPVNVFTFFAVLRILQDPIRLLPDIVGVFIEAKVSLRRIERFLEAPELENRHVRQDLDEENALNQSILIKTQEISWESRKPTLRNVCLDVKSGEKIAICGEIGSGKSTLLAAVLGEVPRIKGSVNVYGKVAFVSQSAWIQTGTIRENIVFGSAMDLERYQAVLKKCCLDKDLEMLPSGDQTGIGERGVNLSGGQKQRVQLARALYQNADVYVLDDPFSAVDAHTATRLFNEYVMEALSEKTVLLVTHQVDFLPAFTSILLMSGGEIIQNGTYDELIDMSQAFRDLVNTHKAVASPEKFSEAASYKNTGIRKNPESKKAEEKIRQAATESDQLIKQEEREKGNTGLKPYKQFLSHEKGFVHFSIAAVVHMVFIAGQMIQGYVLAVDLQNPDVSRSAMISVYSLIGSFLAVILVFRSLSMVLLGRGGSESIFQKLLNSLFRAPMSFYDSTPLGRILSRVSSDLSMVDLEIAFKMTLTVGQMITAYSSFFILAVLSWPLLLVILPMIYLSLLLQNYYYASAKELMRIAGTTKSTVASHLAESISGAMTIRAFGQVSRFFQKHLQLIDTNARPDFHNFSANEWLIQRLELLCAFVLSSSALAITLLPSQSSSSGIIGMSMSYGLTLNVFLVSSVQLQCVLANIIISVERLEQYMHIPRESPEIIHTNRPNQNWPSAGRIEIFNLQVQYRPNAPLVLRGVSCVFQGGHKIGIVGRTGSGKSTLIAALFRIIEPTDGKIFIDDINICTIGLHDLRSRLGIIPQDPTLFSGSVRYNLDPLSEHTDHEIWEEMKFTARSVYGLLKKVLEKCQLREAVENEDEGLDCLVVRDGSNWSIGQRQLFCLGRALLKRSKILVLDEATASMDNATDFILQKTIRTEFADSTIVTVAHRIPTVMDCNMVLSISDGKLVEYDNPLKLMSKEGSLFGQLVNEYWSHGANTASG